MTAHIADIASYQGALTLAQLRAAGFTGVNFKVSHGVGLRAVHPDLWSLAEQAHRDGWKIGSFHWLDNSAGGEAQALHAFTQMKRHDLHVRGCVHTVDVESTEQPPTAAIWRDYCATMVQLLGRPIVTYTGDWWWTSRAKGWVPTPFSPWVWAAPNLGYLPDYPGDDSQHWRAGYGGWPELAVMQYRVKEVSGIRVSQSAVRSEELWREMGGANVAPRWVNVPASTSLLAEFNAAFPARDKRTDGTLGDPAHAQRSSDHNPDETGRTPYEDADSINEVHARDIGDRLNRSGWTMERVIKEIIVPRHRSGQDKRLQNIIHHGKVISRSWGWREWRPASGHETWAHFGFRYGSGSGSGNPENITSPWGILAAVNPPKPKPPVEEVPPVTSPTPATWPNPTVLAVNFYFAEAARAARGQAGGDNTEDRNARNARNALIAVVEAAFTDELSALAEQQRLAGIQLTAIVEALEQPTTPPTEPVPADPNTGTPAP